jgi:hypothetical protein
MPLPRVMAWSLLISDRPRTQLVEPRRCVRQYALKCSAISDWGKSSPHRDRTPPPGPWQTPAVTTQDPTTRAALLRRSFALEYTTLAWNVIGIVILAVAALSARSVALAGFGLGSLIEIGASTGPAVVGGRR